LTGHAADRGPPNRAVGEPLANVEVRHVDKTLNTRLDLARVSDGETLELTVGRPYNDEAATIAAALASAHGGRRPT
jgi:hypothetical protein